MSESYSGAATPLLDGYESSQMGLLSPASSKRESFELTPTDGGPAAGWLEIIQRRVRSDRIATIQTILGHLLPSFVRSSPPRDDGARRELRPSAYLDGVRGVAALFVFMSHYPMMYFEPMNQGFLSTPEDTQILQLPIVRVFYSGWFMVTIFFVLSGYVLSLRPLQLIRAQRDPVVLQHLASSLLRRPLRLFLPTIPAVLFIFLGLFLDWNGNGRPETIYFSAQYDLLHVLIGWWWWMLDFTYPFALTVRRFSYAAHLWTIPIEFCGSLLVFLLLVALSRTRAFVRLACLAAIAIYCLHHTHWPFFLFVSGTILAECSLIRASDPESDPIHRFLSRHHARFVRSSGCARHGLVAGWAIVLVTSLYLGTWPLVHASVTPGYVTLAAITPSRYQSEELRNRFYTSLASVMLLCCLENMPRLQAPFRSRIAQYLGRISFSLYVVHVPLVFTFGWWLALQTTRWIPNHTWGCLLGITLGSPVIIYVADLYSRLVDEPAVRFARWVVGRVSC